MRYKRRKGSVKVAIDGDGIGHGFVLCDAYPGMA
jgi:hypothetical protein